MAFFAIDGQFTNQDPVTIDLKKVLNGFGAKSMVFLNGDQNDNVNIILDGGQTRFTVAAQKQRVITGLDNVTSIVLNYDKNSGGPYSVAISSDVQPPIIEY